MNKHPWDLHDVVECTYCRSSNVCGVLGGEPGQYACLSCLKLFIYNRLVIIEKDKQ